MDCDLKKKPIILYVEDNPHAQSLAEKLAKEGRPGALIPVTKEEFKVLTDPKIFMMI